MSSTFIRAARRSSLAQVRHVSPIRPEAAPDAVAKVYAQVERDFGMLAPPVALHSPSPGVLAACWLMLRETLIATGQADRAVKEAAGTAVSAGNTCPYCVEVHSATLDRLRGRAFDPLGRAATYRRAADGLVESPADPRIREIAAWAQACGRREEAGHHDAPFPADQAPEFIGIVVTFHYLNRMVNVFLRESPFPSGLPITAQSGLMRLLTRILRPTTSKIQPPGLSLNLLPAAPLPDDLSWASAHPDIAGAFARATAAIEAAGARSLPGAVRDLVTTRLAEWSGEHPGPSRAWVNEAVSGLAAADRPAGRLALLTTLASYQIDPSVIDEFRRDHPDDESLIELTAWASLAAARRVGRWTVDSLPTQRAFRTYD